MARRWWGLRRVSVPFRRRTQNVNASDHLTYGRPSFSTVAISASRVHDAPRRARSRRRLSSGGGASDAFDARTKRLMLDNAARRHALYKDAEGGPTDYDYFRREIALRLVDRLDDLRREEGFPLALDLGSGPGHVYRAVCSDDALTEEGGGVGGVRRMVQTDVSEAWLFRDADEPVEGAHRCGTHRVRVDLDGERLPFPDGTFDVVLSAGALHTVNDLPRLFREVRRVLRPDGPFLCATVGGAALPELRSSLVLAESEREGGVSPHVGPFVDPTDVGSLLVDAGLALPTVDVDEIRVGYPDAFTLMEHLGRMGEGNACATRRERVARDTFLAAAAIYQELYGDGEGGVEASVQVIYAIGWAPHESQPKPKERGSATNKVGEIVEVHKTEGATGQGGKD